MKKPCYLDYNATTPLHPEVIAAMKPFLDDEFGNPSSAHWYGIGPKKAVETARRQVAAFLGCAAEEIIFTSGGTEANNHAIKGVALALKDEGRRIVTSKIEHPAVLEVCRFLEGEGYETTYLPVDEFGLVSPRDMEDAIRSDTILISVMHANNEVGVIQPIQEISRIARARGIVMHTDAAQSAGKVRVDVNALGVDLLSIAGHKLYAPKGVGALYVRGAVEIEKFLHGAGQEAGRRGGTENVMQIVGLGQACEIAARDLEQNAAHMESMRKRLWEGLQAFLPEIRLNGHQQLRLPNTLNVSFRNIPANRILEEIGLEVAASAGAACHSDRVDISHVLRAMKVPWEWAAGAVRLTTGRLTTEEEIDSAVHAICNAVSRLDKERQNADSFAGFPVVAD
jgi:cysteine desulfurase